MYHEVINSTVTGALTTGQALFVSTTSRILIALTIAGIVLSLVYIYATIRKQQNEPR